MEKQKIMYDSGNELAAFAAKQINYHVMGYYPITPSTQIAENLDVMGAEGLHDIALIAAEGEHSAAGICYGASAAISRMLCSPLAPERSRFSAICVEGVIG